MLASITLELWDTIKKYLGYNNSGTEVFYDIIQKQQQVNYFAVCALVQSLQKMRLTEETGKDIETSDNKMAEMARRICRTGSSIIELSTLVDTAFIACEFLALHMKNT